MCGRVTDADVCLQARHVVNYEFPGFMSDYIHRVGRVGRVGSLGASFALSYISQKWDVELLWKIEVYVGCCNILTTAVNVNK